MLIVTIGRRSCPAAASALLHLHPRSGTATGGVYIADETGDTTHRPDQRWFSNHQMNPWHAPGQLRQRVRPATQPVRTPR